MEIVGLPPAHQSVRIAVRDASAVGEARRLAVAWAGGLGLDETTSGKLALVVTEAGTNIVRHAGEGELLLRALGSGNVRGMELLALDKGPGMHDVARCLADGYSTGGTSGAGLGGIARLSDSFDVFSVPDCGTAVLSEIWQRADVMAPRATGPLIGAVCVALEGEDACGDGFEAAIEGARASLLIVDGLGHGQGAADATLAALRVFRQYTQVAPSELLERLHEALRHTRGAALALVQLETEAQQLRFAGVGNCAGTIFGGVHARTHLTSYNGIVGGRLGRVRELAYPWPQRGLLVLHTDGLATRWDLASYPGLANHHPSLIAGVLYRDFTRRRDDVTVLALKMTGASLPAGRA
jgi:anti-sigma regulatory factor (Ser/Thr protein kinase)